MKYAGKLTYAAAVKLEPGQFLRCGVIRGLELRAGKTAKSFSFYYRNRDGVRRRPHLGDFPSLTVDKAREAAKAIVDQLALGKDPSAEKAALRSAPTVNDLADKLEALAAKTYAKETQKTVSRILRLYVRHTLGKLHVAAVTVSDCNTLLQKIADGKLMISAKSSRPIAGPVAVTRRPCAASPENAKQVRAYLSKMFAMAEGDSLKWRPRNTNPCQDEETVSFASKKRRTHIATDEFAALNAALQKLAVDYPWHVACLYTELFIGSRVTELATAKRAWLQRDERGNLDLVIAVHKTAKKTGAKTVHITAPAAAIISKLPEHPSGYLFGPLAEIKSPRRAVWAVWDKAREISGIRPEVRVQDLRRTFASVARSSGADLTDIQPLLNHANASTTEHYAFLFDEKKRKLADDTAASISGLLEGPKLARGGRKVWTGNRSSALRFARVRPRA